MAPARFEGVERRRFPALLAAGVAMALVVVAVAFAVDAALGVPVLVLLVVCVVAAIAFRFMAGTNRDDADETDNVLRQPASRSRPLGDTPEAHDEISPHDLLPDSPGREAAEEQAGGLGGTTRGHALGGAAADDGGRLLGADEQHGARP